MKKTFKLFLLLLLAGAFTALFAQAEGDYRSAPTGFGGVGTWNTAADWEVYSFAADGDWIDLPSNTGGYSLPFTSTDVVTIQANHKMELDINPTVLDLTVDANGEITNTSKALQGIIIYGNLVCNGVIGSGSTLALAVAGSGAQGFSGSGIINSAFIYKNTGTSNTLTNSADLRLYNSSNVMYSVSNTLTYAQGASGSLTIPNATTMGLGSVTFNPTLGVVIFSNTSKAGEQTVPDGTYGNLTLSGTGTKTLGAVTVNGTLKLNGSASVTETGLTYGATGVLEYGGSSAQVTGPEWHGATAFYDVKINNVNGVTLSQSDAAVDVTCTVGVLTTGANTLTFTGTATETSGSHVLGNLYITKAPGAVAETFGGIGFAIDGANDPGTITVTRVNGDAGVVSVGSSNSIKRKYVVTATSDNAQSVTSKWFQSEDNGKDVTDMELWQKTAGTFVQNAATGNDASGNPRSFVVGVTTVAGTYAYTDGLSPLPVELTAFTADVINDAVNLKWETATEVDNYGFEVERNLVVEGEKAAWQKVTFVEGAGNSNSPKQYSFVDEDVFFGTYQYRLKQIDTDGSYEYFDVIEVQFGAVPEDYVLNQNYPNPFNPTTTVEFGLPETADVTLSIYNVLGESVTTLHSGVLEAGLHRVDFNASDLTSGIYIYMLKGNNIQITKKMMLMK